MGIMGKRLNLKWVTDEIGDSYKEWKKGDIVTIKAQTGTGKTYFIKNVMIRNIEDYEKMLLICNRINLKRQLKKDLFDYYNIPIPKTFKELDEVQTIGNVTIMSYQSIAELKNCEEYGQAELNLNVYDYIICDECHFFLSDSSFNNKCDLAFDELIRCRHRNAIKIFISATIDEVEQTIIKSVDDIKATGFGSYSDCKIHKYDTNIDYSYLDIKYFKDIKDIIQLIKNDKKEDKWLVFVTNKEKGSKMLEELKGICNCSFITKDTKIDKCDDLKGIINSSKFNSKVLICTKAMDNGINIKDEQVKNIVIMSYDKTTFIQELGRLRFDIDNAPSINLYIPTYNYSTFNTISEKIIANKQKKIDEFNEDRNAFNRNYRRNYKELPHDIFIISKDGNFEINLNGFGRFSKDKSFIEDMINRFENFKLAYINEQLSWLELEETFDQSNLIEDVIEDSSISGMEDRLNELFGRVFLMKPDRNPVIEAIGLIDSHNSILKENKIVYFSSLISLNDYLQSANSNYRIKQFETSRMIEGKKKKFKQAWKLIK